MQSQSRAGRLVGSDEDVSRGASSSSESVAARDLQSLDKWIGAISNISHT